jgi:hypothetical protein
MNDRVVGVCRYCRAPITQLDVDEKRVDLVMSTPDGGKLYVHAKTACVPKSEPGNRT